MICFDRVYNKFTKTLENCGSSDGYVFLRWELGQVQGEIRYCTASSMSRQAQADSGHL